MNVTLSPGDLVEFDFIYGGCALNNKTALYLGEAFIYRAEGLTVENHKVLVLGEYKPTIIDRTLLPRMRKIQ